MGWDKGSLINVGREEVGKNWRVVTISHHLPPSEWCQASLQEMVSLENLPPILLLSKMLWGMEYLFGSFRSAVSLSFLTHLLRGHSRYREGLDAMEALLSNSESIGVL